MVVLEYEDNLHLSWDRQAPPILAAHGGMLEIADGDQIRTLELTAAQLRTGTVAYRKISGHVRFKLEVLLNHGRSVSETWESATR
jgi:hypothetical protein